MRYEIEKFARLAQVTPRDGEAMDWSGTRARASIELPADYRAFIDAFGGGEVYNRFAIQSPQRRCDPAAGFVGLRAMLRAAAELGKIMCGLRAKYPDDFPFAFFPEPGGLLQWGSGIGGEVCFWLTEEEDPADWPVVVWDKAEWRRYDIDMIDVVLLAVTGADPLLKDLFHDPVERVWVPDDPALGCSPLPAPGTVTPRRY